MLEGQAGASQMSQRITNCRLHINLSASTYQKNCVNSRIDDATILLHATSNASEVDSVFSAQRTQFLAANSPAP